MYLNHFNLREYPFRITPDISFLFFSSGMAKSLNTAAVALMFGEGFIKITGEVGTGKTLVCRKLLAYLEKRGFVTAYLINPLMEPVDAYKAFADELGLPPFESQRGFQHFIKQISHHLLKLHQQGKKVVLLVDEAQTLSDQTLEAIRLLTNLETEKRKILQVVLLGQPELDERLKNQHNLRQLQQRITFSCHLTPLNAEEVERYILYRLQVAGSGGRNPFSKPVCRRIYKYSQGIPRLINILSHKALISAMGRADLYVCRNDVDEAAMDTDGVTNPGLVSRWLMRLSSFKQAA